MALPKSAFLFALAALLAVSACSDTDSRLSSEDAVAEFNRLREAGEFRQIFASASPEFQHAGEDRTVRFLALAHQRLGPVQRADQTGWRTKFTTSGTVTILVYDTEFMRGRGQETFTFQHVGGRPVLLGYDLSSDEVMDAMLDSAPPSDPPAAEPEAPPERAPTRVPSA